MYYLISTLLILAVTLIVNLITVKYFIKLYFKEKDKREEQKKEDNNNHFFNEK